jgi:hydrogenase/urease accessory protein HupE
MIRFGIVLIILARAALPTSAIAHEMRPAYLQLREQAADEFSVLWKVPALGDMRLGIYLQMPPTCKPKAEATRAITEAAYVERWIAICPEGLRGQTIFIDGLRSTVTDVLARIEFRDGSVKIARLTPEQPGFIVADDQQFWELALTYFLYGVDHIIFGFDHLLFVLALVLLIHRRWMLLKTITAFTLAHSITLAGATLGYFSLPQKPVEATIALSIAFVASELIKMRAGERRLSETCPWIVAFTFGLLHGFGFAGALREIGLPRSDVPLALLTFNLGVEAGQLMFVAAVLIAYKAVVLSVKIPIVPARIAAAYVIGTAAMVWLVARLDSFLT